MSVIHPNPSVNYVRLEALYEVSRALNSSLELGEALQIVVASAIRLSGAERGFLMLLDEPSRELRFQIALGANREVIDESAFEVSRSVVQEVAHLDLPVVTLNAQKDPRFVGKESIVNYLLRSIMAVPLRARGRVSGVLYVDSKSRDANFGQSDLDLLSTFADQAAIAIVNAQLFDAQKREAEIRRVLLEVAQTAQLANTVPDFLAALANRLPKWLDVDRGLVFVWDAEAGGFSLASVSETPERNFSEALGTLRPAMTPLVQRVLDNPRPFVLKEDEVAEALPNDWAAALGDVSDTLIVPIYITGQLWGALAFDNHRAPRPFASFALGLAQELGHSLAVVIQRLTLFETSQRQLLELGLLHTVALASTEASTEDALIERVTRVIGETLYPDNCGVLLLDPERNELWAHPSYRGEVMDKWVGLPVGTGIIGHVAVTGQPWRSADVSTDPFYRVETLTTRSEMCVPLKVGERVLGVINVESQALNAFTIDDERLVTTIAGQLATAISKLRVLEEERQQRALAEALRDVASLLNSPLDREQLLGLMLEQLARLVPYDSASVLLVEGEQLALVTQRGLDAVDRSLARLPLEALPHVQTVLLNQTPLVIPDVTVDPLWRRFPGLEHIRCWLGVPLLVKDQPIGILNLDKSEPAYYGERDATLALAVANQVAVTLERLRLLAQTQQRERELSILLSVARAVSSSIELEAVCRQVASSMAQALNTEACFVSSYDPVVRTVSAVGWHIRSGAMDERLVVGAFRLEDYPLTARVIDTDAVEVIRASDTDADPAELTLLRNTGYAVLLMLSMRVGGRPVGLLELHTFDAARIFTDSDLRLARAVADQTGVAMENARLFQAEREQRKLAEALRQAATTLSANLDFEAVLDLLLDQVARVIPFEAANVALVDNAAGRVRFVRQRGYEEWAGPEAVEQLRHMTLEIATTSNVRRMVETGEAQVIPDIRADPNWIPTIVSKHFRSWAGAPVMAQRQAIVLFSLYKVEAGFYTAQHADQLAAFAGQAALALQNAQLFDAERRRVTALTVLHEVGLELSTYLDRPTLLQAIVRGAVRLLATKSASFYTFHSGEQVLELTAAHHLPGPFIGLRVPVGEGVVGQVALIGEALVVRDYATWAGRLPVFLELKTRSAMGAPIKWQGQLLGVIIVREDQPNRFNESDVDIFHLFADQAAIALENVRLYEALGQEKQRLELLYHLSQNLAATLNPREVAARAMELMRQALRADRACMYALEAKGQRLRMIHRLGFPTASPEDHAVVLKLGEGITGLAAQQRQVIAAPDVRQHPGWVYVPSLDEGIHSAVAVPLLAGDELVGVLTLGSEGEGYYHDDHVLLLTAAAAPVALALQNARLFEAEAARARYLTLLNDITQAAVTSQDLAGLLRAMVGHLSELTGAEGALITMWDAERPQTAPLMVYRLEDQVFVQSVPPIDSPETVTLTEAVLQSGRARVFGAVEHPDYFHSEVTVLPKAQATLALPLIAGDQKLGAAIVAFNQPHAFGEEEIRWGEQAAAQIALAIARMRLFEATRRHADELAVASDILRTLSVTSNVSGDFPALAVGLRLLTQCARVMLCLMAPDRKSLLIAGTDDPSFMFDREIRLSLGNFATAGDVLADAPHFSPDMSTASRVLDQYFASAGFRSRASLPLRGGGQVIGALLFLWAEPSGYIRVNFNLLSQLTDAVALAIDKGRLFDETLRRAEELQALTEVSAALRMVESPSAVMPILVQHSLAVLRGDAGLLAVPPLPPDTDLIVMHDEGSPLSSLGRSLPLKGSIVGHVYQTGQPYRTDDLVHDPLAYQTNVTMWGHEKHPRAAIYAPLRAGDAIVGIIAVTAAAPRRFTDSDLQLLTAIAELGGNALQRARVLDTLEQRVAERTRELEEANERLKELDRLKDVFISTVSHELRTPLTAIKLHLGLLEKRGAELLPRYLPVLQRETERLRKLIEDLLDLSRLRSQTQPLRRELHRLDTLVAEVLTIHSMRAEERGVILAHTPNAGIPLIPVDVGQITQVFTNLIGNAVMYTLQGGQVSITSGLASSGELEGVSVSVHNDGPPIAVDDLPYLFTRFYRGRTARDSGEPGTGLGLAICKEIVERHAGYIEAASAEGQGTTFTVWLPLRAESEQTE